MFHHLVAKIFSPVKKPQQQGVDFFSLPSSKQEAIIKKAARLSSEDQKNLLKEYDRKFGKTHTCHCE